MKKVEKILLAVVVLVLILSTILVGLPIKNNIEIINCILAIVGLIYVIIKLIKKTPIITNTLDVFVIVLMFSCSIPLIFNTYISLEETVLNIFSYISMVSIYFIVKELMNSEQKRKYIRVIIIAEIVCGIILFIFGIDNLTTNIFENFLSNIGLPKFKNGEERLISSLGYANSLGILMAMNYLLSINIYVKEKNKSLKIFIGSTSYIFLSGLLLTESKGSILTFGLIYIIYLFLNKKTKEKAQIFQITIISIITSFLYYLIFSKFNNNEFIVWTSIILIYLITVLSLWLVRKTTRKMQKIIYNIKIKEFIFIILLVMIVFILIFIIALQFTQPLNLFENKEEGETRRVIRNINSNSIYEISFNIHATTSSVDNIYTINIDEENKYDQVIDTHKIEVGNYEGEKSIKILTSEDTMRLTLRFNKTISENDGKLTIKEFKLNGKEIPLDYKFIPMSLISNIQSLNLSNKNVWERGVFIIDGIKLASQNWLTGIGGNGWEEGYKTVQSYNYNARESHCYITQLWIENGIIAVIAFAGILVIIVRIMLKNKKEHYCNIIFLSILLIILHSCMDFDMSFFCIKIFVFIGLGILSGFETENIKNKILNKVVAIILIVIFMISSVENLKIFVINNDIGDITKKTELDKLAKLLPYSLQIREQQLQNSYQENDDEKVLKVLDEIIKIERNYDEFILYGIIENIAIKQLEIGEQEKGLENLEKAYQVFEKRNKAKLDMDNYKYICQTLENTCQKLENKLKYKQSIIKIEQLIIDTVNEFEENIKDYEITRKSKQEYLEIKVLLNKYKQKAERYIMEG